MRQFATWFFLPLVLAVAGCGSRADSGETVTPEEKFTSVQVRTVEAEDLRESFTLPGTLEAWEDLTLAAEVGGAVRWIGPREGDRVRKGEPLLRIDPETAQANLARAQAEYSLQQKQLERMRELFGQKFVSQQEFDQVDQAHAVAEAELKRARVALEKSTILSPVDGVLDRLFVDRGEYVSEGAPVAAVVQVDKLKILVEVPEKDVAFLRTGQKVRAIPAAIAGDPLPPRDGEIIHLAYKADPATRTFLTKVAVENRDSDLRPGMIVRVEVLRRDLPGVIAIPLFAMVDRGDSKMIFVEEEGIAHSRTVQTGAVIGDRIVIREGLAPGERLIVQGQQLLEDGARIAILEG